ncbi:hypothetical protein Adi01nite_25360 [Amorphoplanes digitatis]|uniref:Uncharacterized protein n=1 Tax=Actinoplanes digitatis TaxID=1868 RepID=A0A7W7HZF2_9ACTN|nr:hypothetical protein [Actinoplanes digitatis]GID93124.1 hypothetical protein Adi01nite_25360 [Actinoplanes digitatis]
MVAITATSALLVGFLAGLISFKVKSRHNTWVSGLRFRARAGGA